MTRPLLLVALALAGCAAPPVCRAGRTPVDGICVRERVADYVACVRAQGAQLAEAHRRRLSIEAGYLGATAGTTLDDDETAEKRYSAADAIVLEIVRACGAVSRTMKPCPGAP